MADQSRTTAFAVPIEDLPCAPDDGDDVPRDRPRSAAQVETTHLQLLQGETKKFGATRTKHICGAYRVEDSMVVTDQRVLFLWRRWLFGMSLMSCEESFYLDDLQFVCLVRMVRWVWLYVALLCILIGAVLLAIGDAFKPKTGYASTRYTTSTSSYTAQTGDQNTYATWVAIGVIILMLGVAFLVVFVLKHLGRGVYMSLNFSRKDIGIVDWAGGSWWRPRHSSTKRLIKLKREKAQTSYNLLNAIIHDKFRVKVARREA